MLLKEQKHKNLNRRYYHGRIKNFEEDKKVFHEFYLTTKKEYSFPYACRGGIIEEYRLKETSDIFNMNCYSDEKAFRDKCNKMCPDLLKYIPHLKNYDWISANGKFLRQMFIQIIRELGYDGYFNKEIDEMVLESYHKEGIYKFSNLTHSPAVALFNKDKLIKLNQYNIEDMVDLEYEKNLVEQKAYIFLLKDRAYPPRKFLQNMWNITYGITAKEILSIFQNITDEKLENKERVLKETIDFYSHR